METARQRIVSRLNPQQEEAVTAPAGPLLILAGAGSGKTSVLTRRIAWMVEEHGTPPHRIIAVTFTNKAASEMRSRVEKLIGPDQAGRLLMGTFHGVCHRFLRIEHAAAGLHPSFRIMDEDDRESLAKSLCTDELADQKKQVSGLIAIISLAKNRLETVDDLSLNAEGPEEEKAAALWRRMEPELERMRSLDFDDLLVRAVRTLEEDADVRRKWQTRFDAVLIDEYQDTSRAQDRLADLLAAGHHNITVVGDAMQSIYGFRGADIENIRTFPVRYPETRTVALGENYRSTQPILDAANTVLAGAADPQKVALFSAKKTGAKPMLVTLADHDAEAGWIVDKVRELIGAGFPTKDQTVLYRSGAQSLALEKACAREGILYRLVGGTRFYQRREVKDVLSYLTLIENDDDEISFFRALATPSRGIGDKGREIIRQHVGSGSRRRMSFVEACASAPLTGKQAAALRSFGALIQELRREAERLPVSKLVKLAFEKSGLEQAMQEEAVREEREGRLENIGELVSAATEHDGVPYPEGLRAFLAQAALQASADEIGGDDRLTLATIHSAKGLEWPVVFINGMDDGVLPSRMSIGEPDRLEEERRLAYVAMTRAKTALFMTRAERRMVWGMWEDTRPSRFAQECTRAGTVQTVDLADKTGQLRRQQPKWNDERRSHFRSVERHAAAAARPAAPSAPARRYRTGQKVTHRVFGPGEILKVEDLATIGDQRLTVRFANGEKQLLASISPLS